MNTTAILIDDEYTNSEVLKYEIEKLNLGVNIIGMYEDAVEGVKALKANKPDILFLDIKMPKLTGFEILDLIKGVVECSVIFVTAFNEYAINAFQYYAIDYLVKPVDPNRLEQAIKKVLDQPKAIPSEVLTEMDNVINDKVDIPSKIVIPISKGYQMIQINDILRCESDSNYTKVYLNKGNILTVSKTLLHFENLLSKAGFLRVHQSHLVNENHILQFIKSDGGHILMTDNTQVPIARSIKGQLNEYFKGKSV